MKRLLVLTFFLAVFFNQHAFAQDDKKATEAAQAATIKSLMDSKKYVFQAEDAYPMKGGIIHLDRGYNVSVTPESIISHLPYYGQVTQASIDQADAGFKFTSSSFEYNQDDRKKGGWDVIIETKDVRYGPKLYLTIQPNGSASLRISSVDRQSISYTGIIEGIK